jgi:putative MATE family efflux protein
MQFTKGARLRDPLDREIFRFSVPVVADQAFVSLIAVVNLIMCHGDGTATISAVGMIDSINSTAYQFFINLAAGGSVMVAQNMGQERHGRAGEAAWQALASGTIFALLLTVVLYFGKDWVLLALCGTKLDAEVLDASHRYFSYSLFSYPMLFYTMQGYGILRGCGNSRTPLYINICTMAVDIVAGLVLIMGIPLGNGARFGGFGVEGVAWTVILSRAVATVVVTMALWHRQNGMRVHFRPWYKADGKLLRQIYGIGIPSSTESIIFMCGRLMTQAFVARMGTIPVAVNNVGNSLCMVLGIPGNAYCTVATTMVGRSVGRVAAGAPPQEVKRTLSISLRQSFVMVWGISLAFLVFAPWLCTLYSDDPVIIEQSAFIIRTYALASSFWPLAFVIPNGFRGARDVRYCFVVAVSSMWACRIVAGYLMGNVWGMGVLGIWLAMYLDWVVRAVLYTTRYCKNTWLRASGIYDQLQQTV